MARGRIARRVTPALVGSLLLTSGIAQSAFAQVPTSITSSGLGTTVTPPNVSPVQITDGTRSGANLFHSFGQFSVGAGDSAIFVNTTPAIRTDNLLGRVTGGTRSSIFGTIDTQSYPGANLFLINPAGWVFGSSASLNVAGSFHVSSADAIRFPDVGGQPAMFHADPSRPSVLSSAPPIAFGFLGPSAGPISIEGAALRVPTGATLSIVGGDVRVGPFEGTRAILEAPGGRVQIVSVVPTGEATIGASGDIRVAPGVPRASIEISNSDINASDFGGGPSGTISIIGGRLVMDAATASVDTFAFDPGLQPGIRLEGTEDVVIRNSSTIGTQTFSDAPASDIELSGRMVSVETGSVIFSRTFGAGRSGDVRLSGTDAVAVSGVGEFFNPTAIINEVFGGDPGFGGRIEISAPTVTISDAASIRTTIFANSGQGGDVVIQAGQLRLTGDAEIVSNSSSARGGNLSLTADSITVSGSPFTRIASTGSGPSEAPPDVFFAGDIVLRAGTISLSGGAQIQSGAQFTETGNVTLDATGSILISSGSRVSSQSFSRPAAPVRISSSVLTVDDALVDTSTLGDGDAASVSINVGTLNLTNGGKVVSTTLSPGRGGTISINATDSISVRGVSLTGLSVTDFIADLRSGVFSESRLEATGNAGEINIAAPRLTLGESGIMSVLTSGVGAAGRLVVNAGDIDVSGGGQLNSGTTGAGAGGSITATVGKLTIDGPGSGFFSNTTAEGTGGNVNVNVQNGTVANQGTMSATSSGTGNAGNINVVIGDTLNLNGGLITTAANSADGGNISITSTGSVLHLTDGQITTSVRSDVGAGGNISIGSSAHPVDFVVLNGSQIRADAFGGPGGNVTIVAGTFLTQDSVLSASSALGVQGTIAVQAGITDVSTTVGQLPESVFQAATLLRAACATRMAGGQSSSLVVSGRDGIPPEPGAVLLSSLVAEGPADVSSVETLPRVPLWAFEPRCLR
jgi:filamentous hemagglutinin family protein